MRASSLSDLVLSDFNLKSGLEDFDEPTVIEGDAAVAETLQDLRRSQAEIAVIGEVREYLTENRTSMNEVKASELRVRVMDAVTAGQLRINPASVIADDTSYNSAASVQYVDAGLESIPGMIMKGIKFLRDLIIRAYKFIKQFYQSARFQLDKYRKRQETIRNFLKDSSKEATPGKMFFDGRELKLDDESFCILASQCDPHDRNLDGNKLTENLAAARAGMNELRDGLITPFADYATRLSNYVRIDYGGYASGMSVISNNIRRLKYVVNDIDGKGAGLTLTNYADNGEVVIKGGINTVINPSSGIKPEAMVSAVGSLVPELRNNVRNGRNGRTVSAPIDVRQAEQMLAFVMGLTDDVIDDGQNAKLYEMEKLVLDATSKLENNSGIASVDYLSDMVAALTACLNITMMLQQYRVNNVSRLCSAMDKYFVACVV